MGIFHNDGTLPQDGGNAPSGAGGNRGKPQQKLAYSIAELSKETSLSRATIYEHIRMGLLQRMKIGGRTIVLHDEVVRWLSSFSRP